MRKFATLLLVSFLLGITLPAFSSPFSDLPADHWATEAVKVLAEKGLVEGYPDGTFKGDRAATRYEVAMIVARLVAYLEKQKPQVTKEDLDTIQRLVDEYKDELDAMGVRMKNVEDTLASLESRVKKLEMVQWSGGFETRFVTAQVKPNDNTKTLTPFVFDSLAVGQRLPIGDQNALWDHVSTYNDHRNKPYDVEGYPMDRMYTVVPTESGTSLSEVGYLKVSAKLSDEYTAGGVVTMYNNHGDLGNGYTYGVTPPLLDNPSYTTSTITNNLNANLAQVFVNANKQSMNAVVGEWRPAYIPDFILQGTPNVGVYGPDFLPFYGGQLYGQLGGDFASGLYYEVAAGKFPAFTTVPYHNEVFGGALGYAWKNPDASVTGAIVRVENDSSSIPAGSSGGVDNPGGWNISGVGIGPQQETLYGVKAKYTFTKWLTIWGKYGNSQYNGNHSSSLYTNIGGSLYNAGITLGDKKRISGGADYVYVQPQYDPFVAEVSLASTAYTGKMNFYSFPYPTSYSPPFTTAFLFNAETNGAGDIFYNAHDSREYPNNRSGYRLWAKWDYGRGKIGGKYEWLSQASSTNTTNEVTPGFYEPIFFTVSGNPSKGHIATWYGYADYTVPSNELTLSGIYISNQIKRPTLDFNNIDLSLNWWRAGAEYRPAGNDMWSILAGYSQTVSNGSGRYLEPVTFGGVVIPPNILFKQKGGYFGVDYKFTKNADAWIMYDLYNLDDNTNGGSIGSATPASGYQGNQLSSGLRFMF